MQDKNQKHIMSDLLLDRNIRTWIFIPIILMTLLLGILKHYLSMCFDKDVINTELIHLREKYYLLRLRTLKMKGSYIPKNSYLIRVNYFVNETNTLKMNKTFANKDVLTPNFNPNVYFNMLKNNLINILPMFLTGSWIVYMYSDFIATKLPFSLTLRFKTMLQRSMSFNELNEPWVSSASWYFLCVFGLRNIFNIILGDDNMANLDKNFDDHFQQQQQHQQSLNNNIEQILQREIEELQIIQHDWILKELKE